MTKWDYRVERCFEDEFYTEHLINMGKQGWECFSIIILPNGEKEFTYKKPIKD
jgi:hypothetical protein